MNERIRELAEQCHHRYSEHHIDLEKFAKLIVKDCIENVKMWEKDSRNHISYMLKNHYEVE